MQCPIYIRADDGHSTTRPQVDICLSYLDDIIVYAPNFQEHQLTKGATPRPRSSVLLPSGLSVNLDRIYSHRSNGSPLFVLASQCQGSLRKTCTLGFEVAGVRQRRHLSTWSLRAAVNIPMRIRCQENLFSKQLSRTVQKSLPSLSAITDYRKEQLKDKHLKSIIKTPEKGDGFQSYHMRNDPR
ncbi:hypothetical protein AVEN_108665-1 [Araneus ventricosus]|uniref:Reverse transcriptase domain-containing protein n=1 Tax=Araneus ventricosus TaxID=182803 RepID=A0A4Y2PRQ9_ARAVE|nr:hypothetical protein AVEN_108665-1 [Araneus ventricosus]